MATHSSILAWRIPWTVSLVSCSPWSRKEVDMTEINTYKISTVNIPVSQMRKLWFSNVK